MANNKDVPHVWRSYGTGTGGYRRLEPMNEAELSARAAQQKAHQAMLHRQEAYEKSLQVDPTPAPTPTLGCVFAKSCNLPDNIIDYHDPTGYVPLERLSDYGEHTLLGAREADESGVFPLKKISGSALPAGLGALALTGTVTAEALGTTAAAGASTVGAAFLSGLVALIWPSTLGDSALYTEDQLRSMTRARTRVRLHVEQQEDGALKGYAFYTGKHRDWEMVDVLQFQKRGIQQVADLGDGIELIWTPAANPADTLGIPALEAAPSTPHIWVYPANEKAAQIIVDPLYPPDYKDFILVFPADSGIRPLYIVVSWKYEDASYHTKRGNSVKSKKPTNGLDALNNSVLVKPSEPRRIGIDPHTKEFVVIDFSTDESFHGHVRPWEGLNQQMKNALIRAGKTNRKGKLLGADK